MQMVACSEDYGFRMAGVRADIGHVILYSEIALRRSKNLIDVGEMQDISY